ncbi:MAG: M20/M25/M40 family metallo-hydrolase [Xanthomonadales bacterium]|nr:M20/M25/M40 family metallo-hydrolase [Xanthomonadales bacterium]NIX13492.1 M20/M25/M40 family metallo-hydrolase [Xanthomonadales bacterium]
MSRQPRIPVFLAVIAASISAPLDADSNTGPRAAAEAAREWRVAHEQLIVDRFSELLRIPNVAADEANIRRNAEHIAGMLEAAGMDADLLELEGSNPAVYAERLVPGAETTVMVYIHYDGQPVDPDDWASDPWSPVMRDGMVEHGGKEVPMRAPFDPEWRIFGRSAGDDKAPIVAMQAALQALDEAGIEPAVNLKMFLDGEEEAGSPNLRGMLEKHRDRLAADVWLFCDGPAHQSRRWQLVYGVRGSYGFNLTVYGPNRPLHSGHYGNWAPNPIALLTGLIGTMRGTDGTILVDGFHDEVRPLSEAERTAIDASPLMDQQLVTEIGIGRPETTDRIEMAIMRPAMNLRGISSGGVGGQSRNAIQPSATASIGLRLVPAQTPAHLRRVVEQHIREQGFHVIHGEPTDQDRLEHERLAQVRWSRSGGYPAYRAPFEHPVAQKLSGILGELSDGTLIQTPTMGGSLPIYVVDEVLDTPVLILPVANHDNNQHGSDENLRLKNLWDAIEIYAAVLTGL